MRLSLANIYFAAIFLLFSLLFVSCDKVDVDFGNANPSGNPDVTYFDNYQVSLQTLQVDSFLTSSQNTFSIGYHRDPVFGRIHAGSYAQVEMPINNPVLGADVSFDSLKLILHTKGNYYGDTTLPFRIKVYQLTQLIQNSTNINDNNFYNTSSFGYDSITPLAVQDISIFPQVDTSIGVQLSSALGQDLLNKLQSGAPEVSTQAAFVNYFNGVYIDVDTSLTNSLYTFNSSGSEDLIMRLYYSLHGITSVPKTMDFTYTPSRQFSHIDYNRAGTGLSSFPPFINNVSLQNSSTSGDKAYLNSSTGDYIKISFPNLLNLETLYPYIKVLSAQLVIPPSPGTYSYPYKLPPVLTLYQTDKNNGLESFITGGNGPATGNLFIDNLYGQSTAYTYDITTFINAVIGQGVSSTAALILSPGGTFGDQTLTRLVVNDQNLPKGIQLKLYLLGL